MKFQINSKRQVAFCIVLIAVIVAIGGYWYYGREKEKIVQQKEKTLAAIATLKAKQIEIWYKEELKDAQEISANPYLAEVVKMFVRSNSTIDRMRFLELLKQIQKEHKLSEVFLTSLEGDIIASANSQITPIYPDELGSLKNITHNKRAVSTGFFNAIQNGNKKHLISYISVVNCEVNNLSYAIIMRQDAHNNILYLIESWPTESQTAKSYIFSYETNSIILFNELKHQLEISIKDKLPFSSDDILSKIYTSRQPGAYKGKDYRNNNVLASMQEIKGTKWVLISQIDKRELLQELKKEALSIIILVLLLVALSILLIVFLFNTRQKNIYKGLLKKERELWEQQEKFNVVMDSIGDGIITVDLNGNIKFLNKSAEELTGWKLREALGRDFHKVYNVINEETGMQENNIVNKVLNKGLVKELSNHTILISKSGTEIPVMDTGAPLFDESGKITGIVISFQDETEKRTQSRLLKQSEEKYRLFYENDITGNYHTTLDGKILICNTAFVKMLKYKSKEEVYAINTSELYFGNSDWEKFINKVRTEKKLQNNELTLKAHDGSEVEIIENVVGVFDQAGELKEIIGYMSDITDKIRAEKELKKKEQLLSSVMETQHELIARYLPDTTLTFVNKAYCKFFGYSENELVGHKFLQFVPESEWNTELSRIGNLNKRNSSITSISQALNADGLINSIEWTDVAIFNDRDEVIEIQSVGHDITEKLKAEQELAYQIKMQELLRKIALNYINIPLEIVDSAIRKSLEEIGQFVNVDRTYVFDYDWNNGVCNNTYEWCGNGITPQINNLQNIPLDDIPFWVKPHKEGKAIIIPDVNALHESDKVRQILEPQDVKSLITIPLMDEYTCIGFLGFDSVLEHHKYKEKEELLLFVFAQMLVNIKKRYIIEQNLIRAKEKAEESDKLKTAFINNISHEIRTPLNTILGFGDLLTEMELSPEEKKEMLALVKDSSDRLLNTVNDYVDIAMIVSGTMEVHKKEFQLYPFFDEIVEKTRHLCEEKDIELETETPMESVDLILDSDPKFILKTLNILLDNAVKFTDKGCIKCGYKINNGYLEFFIQDTGIGISHDKLEMIFKKFAQEETSNTRGYEGSGLGLTIARGLVKLLGGTISATSEKGKGSMFAFTVPFNKM